MDMNEIYKIEHEVITSAFMYDNPKMEDREKDAAKLVAAMTANVFAQKIIINEEIENGKKFGLDVKKGVKDFLEKQFKGYANDMPKTVVAEENGTTTKIPVISMEDVPKIAKEMEK